MKVSLYARVSTDDKGQDPETQMDIIRDIANKRGYEIEGEYVDYASGKDANRPQWKLIMTKVKYHETNGIMALRLDRVMRSVKHLCETIDILKDNEAKLIFSDMEFDPENPNSALTINILSAIAEWERQIISQRTKEGLAHRKSKGAVLGKAKRDIPIRTIALMRLDGKGWATISKELDIPRTTIKGREKEIAAEIERVSDNVPTVEGVSDNGGGRMTARSLYTKSENAEVSENERHPTVKKHKKTDFERGYVYTIEELERITGARYR